MLDAAIMMTRRRGSSIRWGMVWHRMVRRKVRGQ